jgi:ribose/xylose/arabinose/galactoside ABC-type transport system permease subunit
MSEPEITAGPAVTAAEPRPRRPGPFRGVLEHARRHGFVLTFVLVIAVFGALEPDSFLTWDNARSIVDISAPLAVLALAVTVVLLLGEFDLSVAFTTQAAMALAVVLMSKAGAGPFVAVVGGLGIGAAFGVLNGISVAYWRIPSFIATLAIGTVASGFELAIAPSSIFEGVPQSYEHIAKSRVFGGIPLSVVIVAMMAVLLAVLLRKTVYGRHVTAIGDNALAASLSGVPVRRVVFLGLVIAGVAASVAGILLSSKAMSYYPAAAGGLLLPAYAAAFLGLSLGAGWRFNVTGTVLGVLFLSTISTGLVMLQQPTWLATIIQGLLLLISVLVLARRSGTLFK